jgi:cytochrome c peroxidase
MSCASCHVQANGFDTGPNHPVFGNGKPFGLTGKPTPNYPLPLVNLVYNHNGYLWNGFVHGSNNILGSEAYGVPAMAQYHYQNIESLVWMAIEAPHEINGDVERTVALIGSIPMYTPMFKKAFGTEEVTYERISKSLAQFLRSIISYQSKFHQWLRKEVVFTPSEQRGHDLFFSEDADCFHCHGGSILMTTNEYFNNAKDKQPDEPRDRYAVTGDPMDIGAYRAPSLINVEKTAPYMHDGRFNTLDEVIDFYSDGLVYSDYVHPLMKNVRQGGVQLTDAQKADLKAFLLTLTDEAMLQAEQYSRPSELEEPYAIK